MDFGDLFRTIGSLAGIAALLWRGADEFGSYLRISLKVEGPKNAWVTVLSTIDNKGFRKKQLTWAFLLIGPATESPMDTGKALLQHAGIKTLMVYTNDLMNVRAHIGDSVLESDNRMLIPLPFFYSENVSVSDETLTYKSPIYVAKFPASVPFSVRLFVFGDRRLHRSTHDCFIVDTVPHSESPCSNELNPSTTDT